MTLLSLHFARGNVKHIGYENRIFFQGHCFPGCVHAVVEKCQIFKVKCRISIYSYLKI